MYNHPKRTTPSENLSQQIAWQPHPFPQSHRSAHHLLRLLLFLCLQPIFLASAGFAVSQGGGCTKKKKELFNKTLGSRWAAHQRAPRPPPLPAAVSRSSPPAARCSRPPPSPAGSRPRASSAGSCGAAPAPAASSPPGGFPPPPPRSRLQRVPGTVCIGGEDSVTLSPRCLML